jgi:hypothetical protein
MKIINVFDIDEFINASDLHKFIKQYYEFVDVLKITKSLEDFDNSVNVLFNAIFSNDFFKYKVDEISTPELVVEVFNHINNCNNDKPCVPEQLGFLDICYFYGIPVFIKDFDRVKYKIFDFESKIEIIDKNLENKISNEYYPFYYDLGDHRIERKEVFKNILDSYQWSSINESIIYSMYIDKLGLMVYGNRSIDITAFNKKDKKDYLHKLKSIDYKSLFNSGVDLSIYTENSLTYFYEELVG